MNSTVCIPGGLTAQWVMVKESTTSHPPYALESGLGFRALGVCGKCRPLRASSMSFYGSLVCRPDVPSSRLFPSWGFPCPCVPHSGVSSCFSSFRRFSCWSAFSREAWYMALGKSSASTSVFAPYRIRSRSPIASPNSRALAFQSSYSPALSAI